MSFLAFLRQSLLFHWRAHLGVLLGATLATGILSGALIIGESVRHTLLEMGLRRLGGTQWALFTPERLFREQLADALAKPLRADVAPVLSLQGTVSRANGSARANRVQVLGVDERFWKLGGASFRFSKDIQDGVALNQRLAIQLGASVGDVIVLRFNKPTLLSRDAPLSPDDGHVAVLRLKIAAILAGSTFGDFSLQANQVPPFNLFIPLSHVQHAIRTEEQELEELPNKKANLLLVGGLKNGDTLEANGLRDALRATWRLPDAGLQLRLLAKRRLVEIQTNRIFLEEPVEKRILKTFPKSNGHLTYLVNELRKGERSTPYSMVTGMGSPVVPSDMNDEEILVNQWLADDLKCAVGERISLKYFVVGPMRKLIERETPFVVRGILPLSGVAIDPELMPPFPGLAESEDCKKWDPGFPMDVDKIRDKDEDYWDTYRGTPKAFVSLNAARKMWTNRFGALTAIRVPLPEAPLNPFALEADLAPMRIELLDNLDPAQLGLVFQPVRQQALKASSQGFDFGQLFIGFSFFLIGAALLLTGLLFAFGVEKRAVEVGVLMAVGFPVSTIKRMFLAEGCLLALLGSVFGSALGIGYARAMLYGLSTLWRDAVQTSALQYHVTTGTLIMGVVAGMGAALFSMWLVLRKQISRPAHELLSGNASGPVATVGTSRRSLGLAIGSGAVALGLVFAMGARKDPTAAAVFFVAGSLLLTSGIAFASFILNVLVRSAETSAKPNVSVFRMGMSNFIRKRGRSLTTIGLLACGCFLVVAVAAFRKDADFESNKRESGTGGFAFFGESALPVIYDLNSPEGREAFTLAEEDLKGVKVTPLRVLPGEDASCLNLNRAQRPTLWGVPGQALKGRFSFSKALNADSNGDPWSTLDRVDGAEGAEGTDEWVPAIGDENTLMWGLGKGMGGELEFQNERGETFKIRIVGMVSNSILQGSLMISENNFIKHFPGQSGYQAFLVDAPVEGRKGISEVLLKGLEDIGLSLTPTTRRLAEFNAVQNTYLSTFQLLGGLGLLLGSFGLGVVVLRNVLERRGELALLQAVGFRKRTLIWMVGSEHGFLLLYGVGCGLISALCAVLPALRAPDSQLPYASLGLTIGFVLINGLIWMWLATWVSLRGRLLDALQAE